MIRLKPTRLKLDKPLTGPYDRLLRRPGPEVMAFNSGQSTVLIRGTRLVGALPLWETETGCYYPSGGGRKGWSVEDFGPGVQAGHWVAKDRVDLLAVPIGYYKLPNSNWVGQMAPVLTPWKTEVVQEWRAGIKRDLWLTVLRIYRFTPLKPEFLRRDGLVIRVRPFEVENLEPVFAENEFQQELDEVQAVVERHADSAAKVSIGDEKKGQGYGVQSFIDDTGYEPEQIKHWSEQVLRKKQLIIYGPPGSGKTYLAERLARYIAGKRGCSELVQFHPSYAYEDFVQGIRPRVVEGALSYELAEGRFMRFCREARERRDQPCVLVIDEINRANLARVFGELMYLLEYRESRVRLASGGPPFAIPSNVYLIGTMNTSDRSIAMIDQAMRRRFSFIRLSTDYRILAQHLEKCDLASLPLINLVKDVNRAIADEDSELGISFFMVDDLASGLARVWQGEVEPYLEEVFFDRPDEMVRFRWPKVVKDHLKGWLEA